jgi:hypothetical protein
MAVQPETVRRSSKVKRPSQRWTLKWTAPWKKGNANLVSVLVLSAAFLAGCRTHIPNSSAAPVPATATQSQSVAGNQSLSAAEDRARMMELLHVSEPTNLPPLTDDPNRPPNTRRAARGSNYTDDAGNTYARSSWGTWQNYDEARANPHPLPDPLVLKNGQPVKDAAIWWKKRRPEILNDFQNEIYGRIPRRTPKVTWEVTQIETNALNGSAMMKTIVGHIDNSRFTNAIPSIDITLLVPAHASAPVPVMVIVSSGAGRASGAGLVGNSNVMSQILSCGWGYATVNVTAIQPDNGAGLGSGIIGLVNRGQPRKPDDWGALSAWSWGLSRAIDYFETDRSLDAKRLGIEGHSRWGKTALLAAALDPRWAIVYCSCSGEGGAKLSRRNWGETVDNLDGVGLYHWMAGNFLKYAGHWNDLPVDAHELIALVAPRPVFVTGGTHDQWADPHGEFLACVAASPVYRLLGKTGLETKEMPAPDVELISGDLAFREHEGGHTDILDWPTFLKFAGKYFK